jgi:putative ABC transport system substrate-binding protein
MLGINPVEEGLIHSLAQPGGNVTGVTPDAGIEVFGKWVQLLKEVVPRMSQIAVLESKVDALTKSRQTAELGGSVTRELGVAIQLVQHAPLDYADAFARIAREHPDAILVGPGAEHFENRRLIVEFAANNRLPTIYTDRESVADGGLISYGPDLADLARRMAGYVDRILKGAKPGDLPVERPTKFLLTINLKTANSLGVEIPPTLLARADEVIE